MKYTLDTNLYISAFRDPVKRAQLARFEFAYTPMSHLTSIVAHELRTGARTSATQTRVEKNILAPFEKRGRIAAPSYDGWMMAGQIRAALAAQGRSAIRESSLVLVTYNTADFAMIQSVLPQLRFVAPYP